MRKKANLADALAEISGSTRRKPEPEVPQAPQAPQAKQQPSRKGTKPITLHFPESGPQAVQNHGRRAGYHHAQPSRRGIQ